MKNKKTEANISMVVSKTFSGLNMNALKYLLPLWMSPLTGASFRCVFAAVAFWVIGWFMKPEVSTTKDKVWLFLLGAIGIYGFMFLYLVGLSKTTPVSSSIFTSLQPIWVFLIMVFFYKEKATNEMAPRIKEHESPLSAKSIDWNENTRYLDWFIRSLGLHLDPAKRRFSGGRF